MPKQKPASIVAEPSATYERVRPSASKPAHTARTQRMSTAQLLREAVRPMSKRLVRERLEEGWFDRAFLGRVLNISPAQLTARLAGAGTLEPAEAERVLLSSQLIAQGIAAFGDRDVFMAWMSDESPTLQGERPIDLIRTATGMALVMDELTAIEHGLPV